MGSNSIIGGTFVCKLVQSQDAARIKMTYLVHIDIAFSLKAENRRKICYHELFQNFVVHTRRRNECKLLL